MHSKYATVQIMTSTPAAATVCVETTNYLSRSCEQASHAFSLLTHTVYPTRAQLRVHAHQRCSGIL